MALQDAKADSFFLFVLLLKRCGKFLIALIGHNGQCIDGKSVLPLTILIDTEPKTAPDFLPFLDLALSLVQSTDLENIGVIPAFSQSRVGENEPEFAVKGQ